MRNPMSKFLQQRKCWSAAAGLFLALVASTLAPGWNGWQQAQAATDVATLPIFSSTKPAVEVKPNLMFILDDSGSMDWDYMPDVVSNFDCSGGGCSNAKYGFPSNQCNGVYYNPAINYKPPVNAAGNSYLDSSFDAAPLDGYGLTTGTTDLKTKFKAYSNDTAQAAYYYTYSGKQTTERQKNYNDSNSVFYKECNSTVGSTTKHDGTNPVNTIFKKITVSDTSSPTGGDERTNFANWYTYYRTRMNMMKSSTGHAFKSLDNKFRVGFMTLNNNAADSFLNIADFDTTQKTSFYTSLYNSDPGNGTPLRAALSAAGRMYAGKLSSYKSENNTRTFTVKDPVQYACQQNYTLLSTDGYWNGGGGVQLDGSTAVGNQDGLLPRPYNDGTSNTTTTVTPYISTQNRQTDHTAGTVTTPWTRISTTYGSACAALVPPGNLATAYMNVGNGRTGALGKSASNPDSGRCYSLGSQAYFCRNGSSGNPAVNQSKVTDTAGKDWYLVSSVSGKTGCVTANTAFGSAYSNSAGVCPRQNGAGTYVTQRPETQNQIVTGYTESWVDLFEAKQTTTQTTIDGVAGAVGPMSPNPAVYSFKNNVTPVTTGSTGESCGGQPAPCPSAGGTWTAGAPTLNNVCTANVELPVAGTTTPVKGSPVYGGENTVVTTTQLTMQVAGAPEVTVVTTTTGIADTLADVSAYYYATNLRTAALNNCTGPIIAPATTATDLCLEDKVPTTTVDNAKWQHMTTFTLGLGVRGRMVFTPDYLSNKKDDSDFLYVANGVTTGSTTFCTWRDSLTVAAGKCNWPVPSADAPETTDDLWHTAVNGRGNYFSATDPTALATGLSSTLNTITNAPKPGTASAAATTNPKITSVNNFQFSSYFKTMEWSGELIRQAMDLATGKVPEYNHMAPDPATYDWSAQGRLDAQTYTARKIYTKGSSSLINFNWTDLGTAGLQSFFTPPYISTTPPQYHTILTGLSQFCASGSECLTPAAARTETTVATGGAGGEALVNYLRGDRSNEGALTDPSKFFRLRTHVLGDIVSAQPLYVGAPSRFYPDAGYTDFKTLQAKRKAVVYTAANDGMLHAFKSDHSYNSSGVLVTADGGSELWAYIPGFVLPRMYALADKKYGDKHQYSVEGTPISADICPKAPAATCNASEWRTILVGGLNGGGTGYYALDITDPDSPSLLWEFTDDNMGYSFGKPQITKLDDGSWVVMFTSGYNNCPRSTDAKCVKNSTGDGQGYLYVLNAAVGTQLSGSPIATGVGDTVDPSGLNQIVAQIDGNNVTKRVYGGDLYGNLWRFTVETGKFDKHLLATVKDSSGAIQPITVRPVVTTINTNPVVYFGTGRYLGIGDVGGTPKNSFYAITDDLLSTTYYNNPRTYSTFIGQNTFKGKCPAGVPVSICQPGDDVRMVVQTAGKSGDSLVNMKGWYVDFPAGAGEIEFTDPKLTLGTLAFSTSIPVESTALACTEANANEGSAFAYMLNFLTGGAVGTTSGVVGTFLGSGVATAPQIAQLPDGTIIAKYRLSNGQEVTIILRFGGGGGGTKRISWRELVTE